MVMNHAITQTYGMKCQRKSLHINILKPAIEMDAIFIDGKLKLIPCMKMDVIWFL